MSWPEAGSSLSNEYALFLVQVWRKGAERNGTELGRSSEDKGRDFRNDVTGQLCAMVVRYLCSAKPSKGVWSLGKVRKYFDG